MKRVKRNVMAILMAVVLLLQGLSVSANATFPGEAVYDLEKGGTQRFTVMDENSEIGKVVIEEIAGTSRVSNGTYKVSYDFTGYWIAGFYIKVENNKITSAYSPFYSVALGSITNGILNRNSTTKATYAFIYKQLLISHATGVIASINDSKLVVTKK